MQASTGGIHESAWREECAPFARRRAARYAAGAMPLLKPLTRDEIAPELQPLWDECERAYPDFRNSWATMAHSPVLFRHVWGQLLALKHDSPVEARHFEIVILVM
jgi:hypothetical protein